MWDESAKDAPADLEEGARTGPTAPEAELRRPGALDLLIRPKLSLKRLRDHPRDGRSLAAYAAPLVLLPPVARAAGLYMFGGRDAGGAYRVQAAAAALDGAFALVLILIATAGFAGAVFLLARALRARRAPLEALALAVYASTPGWIGGVFRAVPGLEVVSAAFVLLGVRVLWLGAGGLLGLSPRPRIFLAAISLLAAMLIQTLLAELLRLLIAVL